MKTRIHGLSLVLLLAVARTYAVSPADQAFDVVQKAMQGSKFAQARVLARDFTTHFGMDPRAPDVMYLKGLAESKDGSENTARMTWNWLLANHPKSEAAAMALEQLALSYDRQNQKSLKADCLRRLLQGFPSHPITVRLFVQEAEARLVAKDYAAAAALYEKVEAGLDEPNREKFKFAQSMASSNRVDPKLLLNAANRHLEKDDVAQAISYYEEYLSRFADGEGINEAKTKLGWCYGLQNQNEKAERLWESVIRRGPATDPWVGESQWNMIRLLAGPKNKWEQAAKLCSEVAKHFPKQFRGQQSLFTRAWLYWAHKQWEPARAGFDDLLQAYPEMGQHPPIQEYIQQCDDGLAKAGKS